MLDRDTLMQTQNPPKWMQLSATVDESDADALSEWFIAQGALSTSMDDAGDQPLFEPPPGQTPLWQKTRVTGLFEGDVDEPALAASAQHQFGQKILTWKSQGLADQVWERAWEEHFKPMRFGRRLWICPTGHTPPEPSAVNVLLDPGLAFGTGTHPTTALCLEWLDGLDLEGQTVLDYGCGSGILAVAALKLGARFAGGVDIDPQALTASMDNALKNGVEERLVLGYPKDSLIGASDVVVANILAGPLVTLATDILGRLRVGGQLALSGILIDQADQVREAYAAQVDFAPLRQREDWAALVGVKRSE